jgi:hypothetical protein
MLNVGEVIIRKPQREVYQWFVWVKKVDGVLL